MRPRLAPTPWAGRGGIARLKLAEWRCGENPQTRARARAVAMLEKQESMKSGRSTHSGSGSDTGARSSSSDSRTCRTCAKLLA